MADERIAALLRDPPPFHTHNGRPISWGINPGLAALLQREVRPGSRTLETGVGLSTVLFLLLGARHEAISPDEPEALRVRAFCERHDIAATHYVHHLARSEDYLPTLPPEPALDLVLVDGNHAFPAPAIDWYYATRRLKQGGVLILDDVSLWSVRIVADVLAADRDWEQIERTGRFSAHRLRADASTVLGRWWGEQAYVVARSSVRGARGLPFGSFRAWLRQLRR